jgi:hypothetical protein
LRAGKGVAPVAALVHASGSAASGASLLWVSERLASPLVSTLAAPYGFRETQPPRRTASQRWNAEECEKAAWHPIDGTASTRFAYPTSPDAAAWPLEGTGFSVLARIANRGRSLASREGAAAAGASRDSRAVASGGLIARAGSAG